MVDNPLSLNVIAIGAHPDDCEYYFGGTAAKFASSGHRVRFVSVTCGDAGHHVLSGKPLADRRRKEAQEAGRRLGIAAYDVLEHHDGLFVPTLEMRLEIIGLIRDWKADVVLTHRYNDYHPDHRYVSQLVQDSAYLVLVPNLCPDTQVLRRNPVYLYFEDDFRKPQPFTPDVAVAIDDTWQTKLSGLDAHDSQFYEWIPWADWSEEAVPPQPDERKAWLAAKMRRLISEPVRRVLANRYGAEQASQTEHAEAFELCEYGRQPSREELLRLFPY